MKNFIQNGDTITLQAPTNITSGGGVLVGSIFGIACNDALAGTEVEVKRTGVFSMEKVATEAWAVGAPIYWSQSKRLVTTVGNLLVGVATAASANPSATGTVLLNGMVFNTGSSAGNTRSASDSAENLIRDDHGASALTHSTTSTK